MEREPDYIIDKMEKMLEETERGNTDAELSVIAEGHVENIRQQAETY